MTVSPQTISAMTAGTGTPATSALPSGLADGDVMLAVVVVRANCTITTPSGWTQLIHHGFPGGTPTGVVAAYWRPWQTGDAAPSFAHDGGNVGRITAIGRISGADTTAPPLVSFGDVGSGTNMNLFYGLTPTTNQQLLVAVFATADDNDICQTSSPTFSSAPANLWAGGTAYASTAGGDESMAIIYRTVVLGDIGQVRSGTAVQDAVGPDAWGGFNLLFSEPLPPQPPIHLKGAVNPYHRLQAVGRASSR